jgi:hypothetical protein
LRIQLQKFVVLVLVFVILVGNFPAFGLVDVVQFPLDIFEEFVLHGCHSLIPAQKAAMSGDEGVKAQKLPFSQALGLLDVAEGVALEGPAAVRPGLVKFAIGTLNHVSTLVLGKKIS